MHIFLRFPCSSLSLMKVCLVHTQKRKRARKGLLSVPFKIGLWALVFSQLWCCPLIQSEAGTFPTTLATFCILRPLAGEAATISYDEVFYKASHNDLARWNLISDKLWLMKVGLHVKGKAASSQVSRVGHSQDSSHSVS